MDQDRPYIELPDYAVELVSELHALSGAPLRILINEAFHDHAAFNMASSDRPYHELLLKDQHYANLAHKVVSSAIKGIRIYSVPESKRQYPGPPTEHGPIPRDLLTDVRTSGRGRTREQALLYASNIYEVAIQHLASSPIDLRVENEIASRLPEHRDVQNRFVRQCIEGYEQLLSTTPRRFGGIRAERMSLVMTLVSAVEYSRLTETPESPLVAKHDLRGQAEELQHLLHNENDPGYIGDCNIVDAWAEVMGIRHWYQWSPIDLV